MQVAPASMIARLGFVCYWTGTTIAALTVLIGLIIYGLNFPTNQIDQWVGLGMIAIPAGLSWLTGKALRYILVGH